MSYCELGVGWVCEWVGGGVVACELAVEFFDADLERWVGG